MDYEFRIALAEKELAHLRDMQALARSRQDTTDTAIDAIHTTLKHASEMLDQMAARQLELQAAQLITERNLQSLIDALLQGRPNGGSK